MEGLVQIRDELLPLLYYSYLRLYQKIIVEKLPRDSIRKWRNDFLNVESYMDELNYLDTSTGASNEERMKDDPKLLQIFAPNKTITVSQFTFESLFLFIQKNNLQEVDFDVLQSRKINFKIITETSTDVNKKLLKSSFLIPAKDILTISSLKMGVRLEEALYMHLLQSLTEVKRNNETDLSSERLITYIPPLKIELQDSRRIPLPEQSFKHQADFAHAFLNRPAITHEKEPNVLHITVRDPEENVTCVEVDSQGSLVVVGFSNAKILMIIINPEFKKSLDEYEEYKQASTEELTDSLNTAPFVFETGDNSEHEG